MARRRCFTTDHRRVAVRFLDPATGTSQSLTVYGVDLGQVATHMERELALRFGHKQVTSLTDRRHKRR